MTGTPAGGGDEEICGARWRALALVVDISLLGSIAFLYARFAGWSMALELSDHVEFASAEGGRAWRLVSHFLYLAYTTLEIFAAGTPGKLLLGMTIRDESGARASRRALTTRWAIKHGGTVIRFIGMSVLSERLDLAGKLVNLFVLLGYSLIFGGGKQTLHDMLTGTRVYRVKLPWRGSFGGRRDNLP